LQQAAYEAPLWGAERPLGLARMAPFSAASLAANVGCSVPIAEFDRTGFLPAHGHGT